MLLLYVSYVSHFYNVSHSDYMYMTFSSGGGGVGGGVTPRAQF